MKQINFTIQELLGVGFTILVLGIALAYGINILHDQRDTFGEDYCLTEQSSGVAHTTYNTTNHMCSNVTHNVGIPGNTAFQATNYSALSVTEITDKLPTIATIVVAAVIIGILVTYLWARFANV